MKKRDIEKILKEKAMKVEIPDLTQDIINKVDTSKVNKEVYVTKGSKFNFKPLIYISLAVAAMVLTVVVGLNVKNSKNPSNVDVIPSITDTNETTATNTVTDSTTSINDLDDDERIKEILDTDIRKKYDEITQTQAYNIINVANTFTNVSYMTFDTKVSGVDSEFGNVIIDNLNTYIYNIEDMLGINETTISKVYNDNELYNYETKLDINSPYYNYSIYYSDFLEELKSNSEGYKIKSTIEGVIVCSDKIYTFSGIKRIKNNELKYETTIILDDNNYINVVESFKSAANTFNVLFLDSIFAEIVSLSNLIVKSILLLEPA